MPKLWTDTIDAHRQAVRESIMDTAWALVTEHGLTSVTMSQIAERAGIGRATLYKYFGDVEAILLAWHDRQVSSHLEHLTALSEGDGDAGRRLETVLRAYALICHRRGHHGADLTALLHRGEQVTQPQRRLITLFRELLAEAARTGGVRDDVAPDELAGFCLHALSAASGLRYKAAVERLVAVTLAGLRPAS